MTSTSMQAGAPARAAGSASRESPGAGLLRGHIPVLDGLRGLAILLVISNHLGAALQPPFGNRLDYLAEKVTGSAWAGVDLFFVLSGFLITGILVDSREAPGYFRNFYARRSLRIFPLYYLFLILVFVVLPLAGLRVADAHQQANQGWYWAYVSNVLFARDDGIPIGTGHLWSLSLEEQFYLLWPLVVLLVAPRRLARACLAMIAAVAVGRIMLVSMGMTWVQVYVLTPSRLDALAAGGFLALVAREPGGLLRLRSAARTVLPLAIVATVAILLYKPALAIVRGMPVDAVNRGTLAWDVQVQTLRFTVFSALFGALLVRVITAEPGSALSRFFGSAIMRLFGRFSYAIYMVHVPLHALADARGWTSRLPLVAGSQLPRAALVFVLLVCVSALVAFASWHLFEKHFLELKRYFPYDARARSGAADRTTENDREVFTTP